MLSFLFVLTFPAHADVPRSVADAVEIGDCRPVVEALKTSPTGDDQHLALAWCLHKLGRDDEAAVLAPTSPGVWGDYGRLVKAEALADRGHPEDALKALSGLVLPGPTGDEVKLLRGRLLVEAKRSLEARTDLRALLSTDLADEARFWLAKGAEDRGDVDAALPTYRKAWTDSVTGPWSQKAADRLAALGHPVPDLSTDEGRQLVAQRVAALRRANRNEDALALLEPLRKIDPGGASGTLQLAKLRLDARRYADAVEAYKAVLGPPDAATGDAGNLFDYALSTARSGDYTTAGVVYRRLIATHPDAPEADFAAFKIGYMAYDAGDLATARTSLADYATTHPQGQHLDEALWFEARAAWRQGDVPGAVTVFDAMIAATPKSGLVPGAWYWKARAKGTQGDADGEKAALADLVRRYPTSGYAWFACYRLGKTFPHHDRVARPAWPASLAALPAVQRGDALLSAGFQRWARAELDTVAGQAGENQASSLAMAHALIAAGDYQKGRDLARSYCKNPWDAGVDPVAQQACTPMPEPSIVADVAGRYGLDPLLPYGIMNAESGLDPTVTSIAGARGLMQLMPAEQGRIHEELYGSTPYDADDLYAAPYNAALGTCELGMKGKDLGPVLEGTSIPAIIASYNGGEDAVKRWVAAYQGKKPAFDEFAEDVGYTETRQYVRRVLGYVMAYRWVYGDS